MRKLRPRDVRREVGGLGPYQSQQEVSATWPEAAGPHACSCSSVGGPARSSGFESHLHPSLARTPSSLGLSSRTSQTARPFSRSQGVGRGEIEHRLQSPGDGPRWDLRGHFVVCSVPSYCAIGTWEGRTRCPSAMSPPHTGPPATASTGSLLPDSLALSGFRILCPRGFTGHVLCARPCARPSRWPESTITGGRQTLANDSIPNPTRAEARL